MKASINLQFVPLINGDRMGAIDRAIAVIKDSGLYCLVGPFGTAVEGSLEELESLVGMLLRSPGNSTEFLLYVQWHVGESALSIHEKIDKHQ